ncbi:MAG: LPS assembly lipoprotein LptE [Bacteroides sp.]|nr:LPS assembly lipoprotein LptE [Bacteroides sp.]
MKRPGVFLWMAFCLCMLTGCKIYSLSGASIPADAKTMSIAYFRNRAASVQATLSSVFTDRLKEYLISQSNLSLVDGFADLQFSGEITGYTVNPVSIQSNDQAAMNRLTITVQVRYVNRFDAKTNFAQSFSRYRDYDAQLSLASVESSLIEEIVEELVDDIYQRAFVNW